MSMKLSPAKNDPGLKEPPLSILGLSVGVRIRAGLIKKPRDWTARRTIG
jgi:hypothetical protein